MRPVDEYRLMAAYYNGEYTGFIPCAYHAMQVYNGEVQLPDLIKNRSTAFGQFPHLHKNQSQWQKVKKQP